MQYAFLPVGEVDMKVERLPRRPSDNYLRENMAKTLGDRDASFTMTVQLQTDPHRISNQPVRSSSIELAERPFHHHTDARLSVGRARPRSGALGARLDWAATMVLILP